MLLPFFGVLYVVTYFELFERNNKNNLVYSNNVSEKGSFYCIKII